MPFGRPGGVSLNSLPAKSALSSGVVVELWGFRLLDLGPLGMFVETRVDLLLVFGGAFGGFVSHLSRSCHGFMMGLWCVEMLILGYLGLSPVALLFHLSPVVFFLGTGGFELSFIVASHLVLM